ncbi:MAG: HEAT repeat domain-containing protein, partial [Anaerolineae bacterium]|nr:HEAT repeat domain-containing protein [Anaerolineae bacterium]
MPVKSRMSRELQHTFRRLLDTKQALTERVLLSLSDLNREETALFQATWGELPAERRRQLVRALVERAEEDFQVDYSAIFRWLLGDADPGARALAVEGLWEAEDTALIGPLVRLLANDPDVGVRAAAATSLGRYVL